jgi:hypothetical protein
MEGQRVPPVIKRNRVVTNLWRTRQSPGRKLPDLPESVTNRIHRQARHACDLCSG